jgi:CDP-glucose 4,6-dehydratase
MEDMVINSEFWRNRSVFITGHTGFKGSWLSLWLQQLGAQVHGYALEPPAGPSIFKEVNAAVGMNSVIGDVRDSVKLIEAMRKASPDIVIHMAAQPLVRDSYLNPVETYEINVLGTVNLLEAVRQTPSVKAVVNVTTDKCYENQEWVWGYRENEAMGGYDPYSSSKACAELVTSAYRSSFLAEKQIGLASVRAGNVIGGGDWAKDRIVPDAIRAFASKEVLMIRNPLAIRPWQHVLEPLSGYLLLAQNLYLNPSVFAEGWNFGPVDEDAQPVSYIAERLVEYWGEAAHWSLDKDAHPHEARHLKLDCSKARTLLHWKPIWRIERALKESVEWYKACQNRKNMNDFTLHQIATYSREVMANE